MSNVTQTLEESADDVLDNFIKLNIDLSTAKQCAIRSIRLVINELQLIEGQYWLGLKEILDAKREMILLIMNK